MVSSNSSKVIDVSVKDGVVFVMKENGEVKAVKSDYQMQPEDIILSNADADFSLLQNGVPLAVNQPCPTCVAFNSDGAKVVDLDNKLIFSEQNSAISPFSEDDVTAIHNAILAGQDPTAIFEATAAGVENTGAASQGFVVVDYNNDSLLARAGYDTVNTLDDSILTMDLRSASQEFFSANLNRDPDAEPSFESVMEGGNTIYGHIAATDPDGDKLTYSLVDDNPPAGLMFNADGSYQFDPNNAAYDSLKEGETLELTIPFQVSDGRGGSTTETLTITIEGTNDGAVIRPNQPGSDVGAVQEDTILTAGGKLDIVDVDNGEAVFQPQTDVKDGYWGTFSIDVEGNWTYTLNSDHPDVQALDVDSVPVVRTITVTSADGTTHDIVITITGTEDAPEVSGSFTGAVTEGNVGDVATATGTIGISDVDNGDDPVFANTTVQGQYGQLELVDGKWTYTLDQNKVQQLDEGDVVKETITLIASDGTKQDIVIDITGTEDASVVTGSFTGSVTEGNVGDPDSATTTATGTIGISDVDNGDDPVFANTTVQGQYGSLELVDGKWTYTLDQSKVQQLDEGDVVKDSIILIASDGTKQAIVIDIAGTEDAPVVSGSFTGAVTEGNVGDPDSATTTATGTIAISDVDDGDDPVFANATAQGQYGSLELVDGKWTYTIDQSKVQQLDEGDVVKDSITLIASDGTKQEIAIDITGTEDAPVVSGSFTGSVTEGDLTDVATTSGTIGISDVDNGDDPVFANTTVQGTYGQLELIDGKWTYTLDQSKVQQLDEGDVAKDAITLIASDGTKQEIVIDITGTEDAPVVSGSFTGSVTEGNLGDVATATGSIGISDVDNGDDPVFTNATVQGQYGQLELVDGMWTYTLDQSKVQQLDEGDVVKDTITLIASDGTKQEIVIDITGTEDAPEVSGAFIGAVTEGNVGDPDSAATTTTGTIAISDIDNDDDPVFANTTVQGQYGSLELVDGKWTYTLDQSKVQHLDEGDVVKDSITLTASDGTKQEIVIDITGTEDAPVVSGSFTGSVTEGNVGDPDSAATTTAGTIAISDIDNGDDPVFANTTVQGQYGQLELVDGKWTYTLDQSKVQHLDEGDVVKETITLTASDGTKQDIVIDITGTEDAPEVSGSFTGAVTEGNVGDPDSATTTATGTIAISDVDNGDDPVFANTTVQGQYGQLELVDGKWTYTLDQSKVQHLDEGDVVKETITLTASDGTKQDIVIEITGTEDAPEVSGSFTGAVTEGNLGDIATTTGSTEISDVDDGDDPVFANATAQGQYGSLELVDGKWTYTLDQSKVQQLDDGDVVKDSITLIASDGTKQDIVIDITGTEDAPEVSGVFTGSVTEGDLNDVAMATGSIAISDVDNGDDPVFANTTVQGQYGSLELVDSKWTYTLDQSKVQHLDEGDVVKETITLIASDGTKQDIVIDITGTEDAPVVSGSFTGSVTEGNLGDIATATGSIAISDVDNGDNPVFANTTVQGQYGLLELVDGKWTYTLDQNKVQQLDEGDVVKDTITLIASDGTQQEIVIDITGTEDAPEVSGSFTGAVIEGNLGDIATATGTIGISDVDNGDNPVFANITVQGQYGQLELVDGKWAYTLDQSKVQQLDEGDVVKETITLTASDGTKQDIVIDITGTEDAPEVSGSFTGAVTEGNLGDIATATGTIGISDVDNGDDPVFANTTVQGQYGQLELVDGKWTYTLDQSKVQHLDEGDAIKETITLTASDGTKQAIVIDITGTEDASVVTGSFTGSVTEGDLTDVATTSGTIGISDVDNGDDPVFANTTVQGQYGSLELVDGKWTYTLDQSKVQQLDEGDVVKETITLTASDGTKQDIVIDITGTEDAPEVSGVFIGSVTEGDLNDVATATGSIAISDIDNGDDPVFANTTVQGQYGSLELVDGKWTYTLDQSKVQQLDEGDVVKDTITLTASDGTQQDIVIDITGTEDAPVVSGSFTGSVTEGDLTDVATTSGTIGISDVDNGDDPMFANTTVQGQYGSLELVDGKWSYTLDQSKVQQLDEGDVVKETITLTASDGTKQEIEIDITGTEDASVVTGSFTGSVVEGNVGDVATATGTIAISDVDDGDDPVFANTTVQGQYGSLELVDGKWTYTLDQSKVQQLDEGDVVKDSITLTASDGTKQEIVIDITGTEDVPEVSGSFTGSVVEGNVGDIATTSGSIAISDIDDGDDPVFANTTVQGTYGQLELIDGKWTYTLDQSKVQQLDEGDVVKDTITLTASDGTKQEIVIDITGTEDAPEVSGSFIGSVIEGDLGDPDSATTTATGTIAISDVDNGDDPVFANTTVQGQYGQLELVDGKWTYTLDQSKVQQLDEGDVVKDSITLTASDGTKQEIVIDITGTEDAPEVSGSFTGAVTEGNLGDIAMATGSIAISDVDNGDDPVFANTTVQGQYGQLELVDGKWTYTLDQSKVQQLDEGDVVKETITLTASDGTKQDIVIDITGTEDVPEVSGVFTGSVTEGDLNDVAMATGSIAISDVDNGDDPVFANTTVQGQYGQLDLVDGKWTYTLDQSKVQHLDEGDVVKDTITLTASDGTKQEIVIDITGTEDASVVTGLFTGSVTEGDLTDVATATGTIGISDVDNGDNPVFANTTVQGQYGSLELVDSKWTYTLDQSKVQHLDEGDVVKETITLIASDGTKQYIVIDITGTEDAPEVSGSFTGAVTEGNLGDIATATGTIGISDVDNGDDPVFANTTVQGTYGQLELIDGKWTYTLDQSKVQHLDEGDVVKETITLTASDGTKQDIVIDITGTEDASVVTGSFTGSVTEGNVGDPDSATTTATGTIGISDIDNGDDPVFANVTVQGQYGQLELVDDKWAYTLDQSKVQHLDDGDVVKDTITLIASDGTKQEIVIDITGTEDAPEVSGSFTGAVTEGNLGDIATATGTIAISDVDNGDDPVFANATVQGQYGQLELVDGKWTYTLDQSKVQHLNEGEVLKETITLTASDGTTQDIVIDIAGSADAPEFISGNNDQHGLDANGHADADSYQFSVEKGADGVVGKVSAFDVDQNNPVTYRLTSHTDLFEINSLTGEIRVKEGVVLDENKLGDYTLNVEAHDPFGGKDTAQVEVSVNGLNNAYAELNESQLGSEQGAHVEGDLVGNAGPGTGDVYQFSADQNLEGFTSGGQPVTFEVSADNGTLIGYIGSGEGRVTVLEATIDSQTGHYNVDLHAPLDHSGQGEDKLDLTVNVEVQTGDHVENAHLQLGVVDSVPDTGGAHHEINDVEPQNNTVVIALDASGSMKDIVLDADGHPISRWDLAKDSIKAMFEKYDELGEVKFKIAMHGGYPQGQVSGWITSVDDIEAFFATVEPSGWTPYSEAVDEVNQMLSDPDSQAQFEGSDTQLYFISDGQPSDFNNWTDQSDPFYMDARKSLMKWSSADDFDSEQRYQDLLNGVVKPTAAEERIILNNAMESSIASSGQDIENIWAVGIGNNASLEHLESVATDKGSAIVVVDDSQIEDLLGQTVSGQVQGSLLNGQGGDAQWIDSVTVDGFRYQYDRATGTVMKIDEKGVETKLSDHALAQIETAHGQLTVNFENGHYDYTTSDVTGQKQENIGVTIVDGDGDKIDTSITIDIVDSSSSTDSASEAGEKTETVDDGGSVNIAPAEFIASDAHGDSAEKSASVEPSESQELFSVDGDQADDTVLDSHVIMGTDGDDLLSAGLGYDILTGGEGSDTFIWHASDLNATDQPDVITDFALGVDRLDLSDLLPDSANADNGPDMESLLGHLATEFNDEGKVDLTVTTDSGAEQHIELANIDASGLGLDSGAASNDIVNQLFQHNAFKVD